MKRDDCQSLRRSIRGSEGSRGWKSVGKEFEKSPENPFNQVNAQFDTTKEELREIKEKEKEKIESRLVGK